MSYKKDVEDFLISWNVKFKYDRRWRKKYNIPFGSKAHLEANQIDIFLDIYEDILVERVQTKHSKKMKDLEEYNATGKFLNEEVVTEEDDRKFFKKIKFTS